MSGKDWWKRNVFSCRRKEERDGADWMSLGRVFQKVEAATENERWPTVDRRYGGTSSCCVNDDRNRRRPDRFDTGTSRFGYELRWRHTVQHSVCHKRQFEVDPFREFVIVIALKYALFVSWTNWFNYCFNNTINLRLLTQRVMLIVSWP